MLSKLLFLLGVSSIFALASVENDQINWACAPGTSNCFWVSPFEYEKSGGWKLFSWDEAREKCKGIDPKADLATIHAKEEDEFVLDLIQSKVMELGDVGGMSDYGKCWNSHVWIGFRFAANTSPRDEEPINYPDRLPHLPPLPPLPSPPSLPPLPPLPSLPPLSIIRPRRAASTSENVFSWADGTFVGYQHEPNHWHPDVELEYVAMSDPTCTSSIDGNDYGHRRWGWLEHQQAHQMARYLCGKTRA
ncbi:unnamed protein product, partial [Mesorhabditis belari]|uniref:C-type lectin domain-containing protein n=1 Tax=Mesorhabditis belari TaxID=2138241 RepID=A0AAF3FQB8_9BILA